MDMGWVNTWVGLDWVALGPNFSMCNGLGWVGSRLWKLAFFIHMLLVYLLLIILIYWNSKQTQPCDSFDPFAELRGGTSTSGTENDTNLQFSGRNELATTTLWKCQLLLVGRWTSRDNSPPTVQSSHKYPVVCWPFRPALHNPRGTFGPWVTPSQT